ncbi:type II toxin-antitoxin system death-on-curing family toxin [Longimonas halophila]|jgi:death-on-curing protein|uniref:Type II toxin-antitoxin system death-on-curing family toxin n=1 Tax=Longimonas halophila TaxID=1469170 RepID=A0A2H3P4Q5_9BACT|nr:type II toxin-antitoxin system death-on-curing family toxin [Longimonas halophila]PEN05524.1 type II toxin-antitoxin system death-on-curing family toxin [Longimonas halophila]
MPDSSPDEPRWLSRTIVDAIHDDQINSHGGLPGINNDGLIESALARPRNRWAYGGPETDLATLAAAYGFGIAKNHGYRDANKRTAFMSMYVFLGLNGRRIVAEQKEVVSLMEDIAADRCAEEELASWLRSHTEPR